MAKRNAALDAISSPRPKETAAVVPLNPQAESPTPVTAVAKAKDIDKVMLYLPPKVARKFKEIAFHEDCKAHDVYLRALAAFLRSEGHGGVADLIKR